MAAGLRSTDLPAARPAEARAADEEQRLREAASADPAAPGPRLDLARYLLRQGRVGEAVWEYQEVAGTRPEVVAAHVELAAALGRLRLHASAIRPLEERLQGATSSAPLRRELAERYLAAGRPERAAALLTESGAEAASAGALTLGRACLALGRPEAARDAFRQYAAHAPEDAEGPYWLGRAAWTLGRAEEARRLWQRAAALAPNDPRIPYHLGISYARDPNPQTVDRAGAAFDEALRRDPRYVPALIQLGLLFQRHRRYRDAARHYLQAIDLAPTDPEPHRHLADALAALGERAEAHRRRGLAFALSDQPARAIQEYERLQRLDPDGTDAPVLMSQSYIQLQQYERAVAVLEPALRRHPGHPVLSERLATLYVLLHSPKETAAICEAWLRSDPEAARVHWIRGRSAYGDQRIEDAARHYEAALARAPDEPEYLFALGGALEQLGGAENRARSLGLLKRAAELKPEVADYRFRLGALYQQQGEWEPARRELLAAITRDPLHTGAYNGLTQVAQALQRPHQTRLWAGDLRDVQQRGREETRARLEVRARPRDAEAWFALGETLRRFGELEKARGPLEQALQLRPGWPEARRALARIDAVRALL